MRSSASKSFYRTFGSLKLAVVLLASLTATLIFSTFYESKTSTREVQMLVYQSWWFVGLLLLLGVNVFAAAMARYPWKGYQTGFVITHLGIIILLIGSIIGLLFGVEGNVTMVEGGPPRTTLSQDFEVVQIASKRDGLVASIPLEVERKPLRPGETRRLKAPKFGLDVALKAQYPNTKEELIVKDGGPRNPTVKFSFSSKLPGMEQSGMQVSDWLVTQDAERRAISTGPATFKIEALKSPDDLARKLNPPKEAKGHLHLHADGKDYDIPVNQYLTNEFKSPDGNFTVKLEEYFADLRIQEKKPISVSDEPNNPAVFFSIITPAGKSKGFAFADYPDMNMVQGEDGPNKSIQVSYHFDDRTGKNPEGGIATAHNTVTVLVTPDNKLYYTSQSSRSGFHSGELKVGVGAQISPKSPIQPELKVLEFYPNPQITTRMVPAGTNETTQFIFPAIELDLKAGGQSTNAFVRWGEPKSVNVGGNEYELTYGFATVPLDFSIQLEKFDMPKYEGTDEPEGYESYVKVRDVKKGKEFSQKIWMNNPMTYNGYRLSQASFDPPEKTGLSGYRSTLQVLKDPGWLFKWVGSLLIVTGIVVMFYIKPYFKGLQKERARRAAEAATQKQTAAVAR